mgnify:CR=1 FL=1|tara:strand:+ start:4039 stop:4176 length:138 start_codon:yes stop_codon:yes gene_type:complete
MMKTYVELERDAYMAGNTELAKLYAELEDVDHNLYVYEQLRDDNE